LNNEKGLLSSTFSFFKIFAVIGMTR